MKSFRFSKKVGAVVFALAVAVSSASAVEFTVGAKVLGNVNFYTTDYEEEHMTVGLGGSAFGAIDFLQFGICKLGVRPEVVAYYSPIYTDRKSGGGHGMFFSIRLPATVTFALTDSFDLGAGAGFALGEHTGFALAVNAFGALKTGPGKIVAEVESDFGIADSFKPLIYFGAGYQYTF